MNDCNEAANRLGELIERHPTLFRGQPPEAHSYVLEGWFALVDELCTDLEQLLGDRAKAFVVDQVKEKFGGLRFYWSMRGAKATFEMDIGGATSLALGGSSSTAEGYVDVSNTPRGLRISIRPDDDLSAAIAARIRRAEEASFTICETCGAPGRRLVSEAWLETACDQHKRPGAKPYERTEESGGVP